jgi:hypothetical protein
VAAVTANPNKDTIQTKGISALSTYDATPYGSGNVEVTSALGKSLGFTGMLGITTAGDACNSPGTSGCYNVLITVTNDPSTPIFYSDAGGTEPSDAYDFYAVVQHEVDEMLGTSSCIGTQSETLTDGCDFDGGNGVPSAVDLYRFSSPGTLALDTSPSTAAGQYFSYNGGANYGVAGDTGNIGKVYNTLANGEDFADFAATEPGDCAYNEAIQDAEGCPGEDGGLTVLNDGQASLVMLVAVGYQVPGTSTPAHATLTSPAPSSTLTGSSVKFTWSAISGSQGYWLFLGTTGVGSSNLYDSHQTSATSVTVNNLPTGAAKIYARVYTELNGTLYSNDYTYTEATKPPVMVTPAPSSTLTGTSATFTWTASGGQGYWLFVGTTGVGSKNIKDTGQQSANSATVSGLPSNGAKLYVRVYSYVNGTLYFNDYTYTSYMQPPVLTSPTPSSTLAGSTVKFTWTAEASSKGYWLFLGTTGVGSDNLYDSHQTSATSETVSGLPTNGVKIYARVYALYNGVLVYNDYTYTAK